jgi:hypothetical protein
VFIENFLVCIDTVTFERDCCTLRMLCQAIRRKRPGLLHQDVSSLHNSRTHTVNRTCDVLTFGMLWNALRTVPMSDHLFGSF